MKKRTRTHSRFEGSQLYGPSGVWWAKTAAFSAGRGGMLLFARPVAQDLPRRDSPQRAAGPHDWPGAHWGSDKNYPARYAKAAGAVQPAGGYPLRGWRPDRLQQAIRDGVPPSAQPPAGDACQCVCAPLRGTGHRADLPYP